MKPATQILLASCAGIMLLSACTSFPRLSPDFGVATRQNEAAQIADPEARYGGVPTPGSNGERAELAQTRYVRGQVIPPTSISATTPVAGAGAGFGTSGQGSAPAAPAAGQ